MNKFNYFINYIILPIIFYIFISLFSNIINYLVFDNKYNILYITTVVYSLSLIILFFYLKKAMTDRDDSYRKLSKRIIFYFVSLSVSLSIIGNVILEITNILPNDDIAKKVSSSIHSMNPFMIFFSTIIVFPLIEEIIFLGFVYKTIKYIANNTSEILISSFLFGLFHGNLSQGLYAFFIGIVLCYIYNRFDNIIGCCILHSLMNLCSILFIDSILELSLVYKYYIIFLCILLFIITMHRIKNIKN